MFVPRQLIVLGTLSLLLPACREAKVTSYRVPKEKDPEMPAATSPAAADAAAPAGAPSTMAGTPVATASGAGLTWTAPAHWKTKPGSAMRKGSYSVTGDSGAEADLSITAFPGNVGGELANVNRWRDQVQLPPVSDAVLASSVTRSEHDGLKMTVVDIAGANAQRILGAMIPFGGATWFFKLTGPDALVAKEKPAFMAFLQTVKSPAPVTP